MPDITVETEYVYEAGELPLRLGVLIKTPSEQSETGFAWAAFLVDRLDDINSTQIEHAAYTLASFNGEQERIEDYRRAIEPKVMEVAGRAT